MMHEEVKMSLISLSWVFKIICSKAIDLKTMPMLRFKWFLLLKIQLYSKNQVLEGKISWVHGNTWANGTGHTSLSKDTKFIQLKHVFNLDL
jgi:hypothetical protein